MEKEFLPNKPYFIPQKEYRDLPFLSSSDIREILNNPYNFKNGIKQGDSTSLLLGSAIHCLILEPCNFKRDFLEIPKLDLRKKEDKELKESLLLEAQNSGKTLIGYDIAEEAREVVASFKANKAYTLLNSGYSETSYFGEVFNVKCKCRPDFFNTKDNVIFDIKTTSKVGGASPKEFIKSVANFGYFIQAWLYKEITKAKDFFFIVIETEPPFMVGIYDLDNVSLDFGKEKVKEAFAILSRLESFKSPLYLDKELKAVQTLTLPNWVYY